MRRFFYCFLVLWLAVDAQGQEPRSLDDSWNDTLLHFGWVRERISPENCYASERSFTACGYALDEMLGLHSPPLRIVPDSTLGNTKPVARIGDLALVTLPTFEGLQGSAFYRAARADRKNRTQSWEKYFAATRSKHRNFSDVLDWIQNDQKFFGKHPNLVASAGVNAEVSVGTDPHSGYMPLTYFYQLMRGETKEVVGIGSQIATVLQEGKKALVILSVVPGGPADQAGLQARDRIISIDGEAVGDMADAVVKRVRGEAGTKVKLEFVREGQLLSLEIVRARVKPQNVTTRIERRNGVSVGFIRLENFVERATSEDFKKALLSLMDQKVDVLAIDLRQNLGGLMDEAVKIAAMFLPKDSLVTYSKSIHGQEQVEEYWTTTDPLTDLPLFAMVDEKSASASELLTGALQDHRRAVVLGNRSFGKGSVQAVQTLFLSNLAYRETIARFYRPSLLPLTNQGVGISPDLPVYRNPDDNEAERDAWREEDEYLALSNTGTTWVQPAPEFVSEMQSCIEAQGTAKKLWAERKTVPLKADFQTLYAVDAAECWARRGFLLPGEALVIRRDQPLNPAGRLFSAATH